jgi:uncharacterized protein YqhQ
VIDLKDVLAKDTVETIIKLMLLSTSIWLISYHSKVKKTEVTCYLVYLLSALIDEKTVDRN